MRESFRNFEKVSEIHHGRGILIYDQKGSGLRVFILIPRDFLPGGSDLSFIIWDHLPTPDRTKNVLPNKNDGWKCKKEKSWSKNDSPHLEKTDRQ